jgi:hypothetical protein
MLNSPLPPPAGPEARDADIEAIVASGPRGAIAVAGIATFLVVAIWFAGSLSIVVHWLISWRSIARVVRAGTVLQTGREAALLRRLINGLPLIIALFAPWPHSRESTRPRCRRPASKSSIRPAFISAVSLSRPISAARSNPTAR